ncbi:MAG TPA: metalloregulator ArsR/SmtB family transcription factor [Candidatus Hydrogenedentes bacterium]|jgi:DNA-binding transcriptional ArsR family regulator|nr:metalloregulator ArsR/SmtB family transcription factor [Candidatus Hydrogenedentota bacterium]HOR51232.1 metalloregulator ArsR/SmtB family transcription factor [Candidatus Hydrogenedentota bacterium]HPK24682.1 metalloregulator ArsR/SmtB family transcription factor [Candidatus Hydrogenedentota bacterium]
MKIFMMQAKAIADETRARILLLLAEEELCLCQLIALLDLAPSTVSRHMSILVQADLVLSRKEGRWKFYRLPDKRPDDLAAELLHWVSRSLKSADIVKKDKKQLVWVLKQDKKELCDRYCC